MSVETILDKAKGEPLTSAIVVGMTEDGGIRVFSHPDNVVTANWLLDVGKHSLMNYTFNRKEEE
jgi:hypothetical protein